MRSLTFSLMFAVAGLFATAAQAHDAPVKSAVDLGLQTEAVPIAARFSVTVERDRKSVV